MRTRACDLLRIEHPVALGGMAGVTAARLVAAVSNAGGLGTLGCANQAPAWITAAAREVREKTDRPFALNLLLFLADEPSIGAVLEAKPPVFSTSWPPGGYDLKALFARAHDAGSKVMHMVSTVAEARRAAEAGADLVVAQGSEGGGHVGLIGTITLVPMVVRAVTPLPVLAAGGIATGEGLAAALALGADGVLLGTRFLATEESPLPDAFQRAILASDGHNTLLTEIPDVARGRVWPGAFSRVARNRFIERWAGREGELRARQPEAAAALQRAVAAGDAEEAALFMGQDAGLIETIEPAADVLRRIVAEAEQILGRLGKNMAGSR
ncbi:MAG: nitronate monooxygenase family protein [Acidobacteriota bacterium]|nr:nitronate monooxygenase family protein [Acidobacteriota bacterium]